MTLYVRRGNTFTRTDRSEVDIHTKLPAGNYTVKQSPISDELYLEQIEPFTPNKKLYGNTTNHANRIITTFQSREASTGVLLCGEKGSGKTLLAKTLSLNCYELGIPTIVIAAPWCGEQFNNLIRDINQPAVIIFDEFEKVYDVEQQSLLLPLLDGVYPTKKLFIVTCNNKYGVNDYLRNRPGRMFYAIDFGGIDPAFIAEYCEVELNNKSYIDNICKISTMFTAFNFDMLQSLVEEMNRFGESPQAALAMLNITLANDTNNGKYDIALYFRGKQIAKTNMQTLTYHNNPLSVEHIVVEYRIGQSKNDDNIDGTMCGDDSYSRWNDACFTYPDIKYIGNGEIVYENKSGEKAVFTKSKPTLINYFTF